MQYIKDIIAKLKELEGTKDISTGFYLIPAIKEGLEELKILNFPPSQRTGFSISKATFLNKTNQLSSLNIDKLKRINLILQEIDTHLETYETFGSGNNLREFDYIHNSDLKTIIIRDYYELRMLVYRSGAWKSCMVLAGSILEAILHDVLTEPSREPLAQNSSKAPVNQAGNIITNISKWNLASLIKVSEDINLFDSKRSATFDQTLRDFRNFIHPLKEIRAQHPCKEAEAMMAIGALEGICDHFESTL